MKKSCAVFLVMMFCVCITSLPVFAENNEWLLTKTQTDTDNDGSYEEVNEYTYEYDDDDRLSYERKEWIIESSSATVITAIGRTYDIYGNKITEQETSYPGSTRPDWTNDGTFYSEITNTYTYGSSRNLIALTIRADTNGDGTADEVYEHIYDHDTNGRVTTDREVIDYDNDAARDAVKLTTYTYDADGNKVSEQIKSDNDNDGSFDYIYFYAYIYDDSGNLIRINIAYDDDNDGMTDRKKATTYTYTSDVSGKIIHTRTESRDNNGLLTAVKLNTKTYDIEDNLINETNETDNNNDGIFIVDSLSYRYTGGQRTYLGYDQGDDGSIESYTYYEWRQANGNDVDNDGDTYKENQGDCDDTDATINPGAVEICEDGIDQDCDGCDLECPDPLDVDDDGDGYTENQGDCDDDDPANNPGDGFNCGDWIDQEDSYKMYYPHVASGEEWETEICVINTSNNTINGVFKPYNDAGESVSIDITVSLEPNARKEITIGNEFNTPSDIGYIMFESDSENVTGYTKFYKAGKHRVAVPAVADITTGDLYISHIASNNKWWTGISLVNTTSTEKNLLIELDDNSSKLVTLAAYGHKAFSIKFLYDNTPQDQLNSAIIKDADGVIGLELFGGTNQLSGILLKNDTATDMYYPHIASPDNWWTGIVAYNPSASSCTLTINPYTAQGLALASQDVILRGYEKYVGITTELGLPPNSEWFQIQATNPITGFELFGSSNSNRLAGYTGVNISKTDGIFSKIETAGWTGIAFVNIGNSSATVNLTAYDDSGQVIDAESISLAGYAKMVGNPESIFENDITSATYIAYSSDQELVGFQLNGSSDKMMLDGLPGL